MAKSLEQLQREALEEYINDVRLDIIKEQNAAQPFPFRASGNLQAKMKVQYSTASDTAYLDSPSYLPTTFQGNGVKPKKIFPFNQLIQWLRFKNIQGVRDERGRFLPRKSIAYLMARKIWMQGNALYRGERQGVPINKVLRRNLPDTAQKLAKAYAQEFIRQTKKEID